MTRDEREDAELQGMYRRCPVISLSCCGNPVDHYFLRKSGPVSITGDLQGQPDMGDPSVTVYNERVKLHAAFLNGLAIAVFAIGGFSPVVSGVFNESGPTGLTVFMGFICFQLPAVYICSAD